MISSRAKRPPPSRGTSRWLRTQRSVSARRARICSCSSGLEHAQDAVDGLARIDGVQRAEHQVAGFRGAQRDLDRFAVAHFADENDLGRLAQGGAQPAGESVKIGAQLALIEGGAFVGMHEFDRVFQRDDVDGPGVVDLVQNCSQGGGFAGAGGAGDQHQARSFRAGSV